MGRGTVEALTGRAIDAMDDEALRAALPTTAVFARTSPEHKLRLVEALQADGAVVSMTGDGVNDAPALKRADVGVAMGRKGTEAAKEAAEMVLADDNFATIAAAVREGRIVYDNLVKVVGWTLPTNGGQAMAIVAAVLPGVSLPMTPAQIFWVNMVTGVTLGLVFAFDPAEPGVMGGRRAIRARRSSRACSPGGRRWCRRCFASSCSRSSSGRSGAARRSSTPDFRRQRDGRTRDRLSVQRPASAQRAVRFPRHTADARASDSASAPSSCCKSCSPTCRRSKSSTTRGRSTGPIWAWRRSPRSASSWCSSWRRPSALACSARGGREARRLVHAPGSAAPIAL